MKCILKTAGLAALLAVTVSSTTQAMTINGFRSAKFGANEKEILQAAMRDLHLKEKDILKTQDNVTKVVILSAKLVELEPLGIPATVSYIMGYKCNCLMRVVVQWNYPKNATAAQRSVAMAGVTALSNRFQGEEWNKDETVINRLSSQSSDGSEGIIVFFRGQNAQGGAITLLGGPARLAKNNAKPDNINANVDSLQTVSVIYERDAKNPDIKKVDVSGF